MSEVIIKVKVIPNASVDKVVGWLGDALKVKVQAAPEAGRANEAVVRLLVKALGVGKRDVEIVGGATSRDKQLRVKGLSMEEIRKRTGFIEQLGLL